MTTPAAPDPERPRLAWLRILGAALAGVSALSVVAVLQGYLDGTADITHDRGLVLLVFIFVCGPVGLACFWAWWRLSGRYDTAENYVDKPMAFAPPVGPDPASPDRVFVEGGYAYQLLVLPARAPLLLTRGSGSGDGGNIVFQLLFEAGTWFGSRLLDRRWKVVVSRRLRAAGHWWITLAIDVFDDEADAHARVGEVITTWDATKYAAMAPLTGAQIRAARRANS